MADIERVIMPGVTHWHSPHFHAYFPTANSYPAIVAVILPCHLIFHLLLKCFNLSFDFRQKQIDFIYKLFT